MNQAPKPAPLRPGQVRIIGGRWRGSKLPVPAIDGLRPTSDRVRETVFNWLQGEVAGARVLDLFAGTGALGLEAASRGAARVDLVEAETRAAAGLRETVARLARGDDAPAVEVHAETAARYLARAAAEGRSWDLVFVDPPFAAGLWTSTLQSLGPVLAARAHVYVEAPPTAAFALPSVWRRHREIGTREAHACLYRVGTD